MKRSQVLMGMAFSIMASTAVQAGGPTEAHPCYAVADCKTQTSQPEFSKCIKANEAEANANQACAEFRADKKAYMAKHGLNGLKDLFSQ